MSKQKAQGRNVGLSAELDDAVRQVAPLASVEARYKDLLQLLGVQGHDGAIAEIDALRKIAGLNV